MVERRNKASLGARFLVLCLLLSALSGCNLFESSAPLPPERVEATMDEFADHIHIEWSAVPDAEAYELWRASSADGEYDFLVRTEHLSYDDFSVTPGEEYWYKVRSCNQSGCGDFCAPVKGRAHPRRVPSTPTDVQASQGTYADHIALMWSAVEGATYYEIYRAETVGGGFKLLATVEEPQYDDYEVTPGQTYWYKVRACNDSACSELSEAVSGYVMGLPVPTGVSATDGDYVDKIVITWNAVEGATSYIVYRAETEEGPFESIAEVEETSYEDLDVAPHKTYWYKVRACNADACSGLSEADEGKTAGPPLPPE